MIAAGGRARTARHENSFTLKARSSSFFAFSEIGIAYVVNGALRGEPKGGDTLGDA